MSKKYLRQRRTFSPTLRKQIVGLIESGKLSASAASREYMVSLTTIYRWIYRYSTYNKKGTVLVVDKDSQTEPMKQMPRGRDWTEQLLLGCGYRVKTPPRSFNVAGQGVRANLIEGMRICEPTQVWQTDITYVLAGRRWYYVSLVVDVYTRQILASHCSRDLSAASQGCAVVQPQQTTTGAAIKVVTGSICQRTQSG